eukprot:4575891-Pyramimonas_sp.AAC.1
MFSDSGWVFLVQRDFGFSVIRALGPDGNAMVWVNLHSDSSCIMQCKSGKLREKKSPCQGVGDMNDPRLRKQIVDASNP